MVRQLATTLTLTLIRRLTISSLRRQTVMQQQCTMATATWLATPQGTFFFAGNTCLPLPLTIPMVCLYHLVLAFTTPGLTYCFQVCTSQLRGTDMDTGTVTDMDTLMSTVRCGWASLGMFTRERLRQPLLQPQPLTTSSRKWVQGMGIL